jgi:hypothetical protein
MFSNSDEFISSSEFSPNKDTYEWRVRLRHFAARTFSRRPFARDAEDCSLPLRKRAISALVTSIDVVTTSRSISRFAIEGARAPAGTILVIRTRRAISM